MGVDITHYIGPYVKIKTKQVEFKETRLACENGHEGRGSFCQQCGTEIKRREVSKIDYPSYWDIESEEFEDELAEAHDVGENDGEIILIGNKSNDGSLFTHSSREWAGALSLPYGKEETDQYIDVFKERYKDVLKYLSTVDSIEEMTLRFGYVVYCH